MRKGAYILAEATDTDGNVVRAAVDFDRVPVQRFPWCLKRANNFKKKVFRLELFRCRVGSCLKNSHANTERKCYHPSVTARVAVEAGVPQGWDRYVGPSGVIVGLDRFGASAPGDVAIRELGFTVENVVSNARVVVSEWYAATDDTDETDQGSYLTSAHF